MSRSEPPKFSRSARHLFGKRTVAKHTKVSEETSDALARAAAAAGKTESDFVATLIEIRVHGYETVASMQRESLAVVSGMAPKENR